jgi:hypothetical protein
MAAAHHPPHPPSVPYDYLFKVLIIGDASVGKVRDRLGRRKGGAPLAWCCPTHAPEHVIS